MKVENFNSKGGKTCVLVAPLDWGLGHATRCIPIIFKLIQQNCNVIIAAEGASKHLLKEEFPDLIFLNLRGYRIKYGRNKFWMPVRLISQFPKIIYRIYSEHHWLNKTIKQHAIDAVISDNRFGMYHKNIPSVYITHQLKIKTGNRLTEWAAQKIHYLFINKFAACWVPDSAGEINLAGELSHTNTRPAIPIKYIGPLSRFEYNESEIKYDLAIILSGPEPQRTVFEKMIIKDLEHFKGKVFMLRGLPGKNAINELGNSSLVIHDHLPAAELNLVLQQSKIVISRCGYSSVMDLIKLQKKAVLVPTPGQTEQEYLADYLMGQKLFMCVAQENFSLQDVLKKATAFAYTTRHWEKDYEKTVEDFIKTTGNQPL